MKISTLVFVLFLLFLVSFGCKSSAKPAPAKYVGDWQGQDGTTISILSDGTGSFKTGSKKVTNGTAEIDEAAKTLTISLFGISETWKIDQEPNDNGEMKLNGVTFRRK